MFSPARCRCHSVFSRAPTVAGVSPRGRLVQRLRGLVRGVRRRRAGRAGAVNREIRLCQVWSKSSPGAGFFWLATGTRRPPASEAFDRVSEETQHKETGHEGVLRDSHLFLGIERGDCPAALATLSATLSRCAMRRNDPPRRVNCATEGSVGLRPAGGATRRGGRIARLRARLGGRFLTGAVRITRADTARRRSGRAGARPRPSCGSAGASRLPDSRRGVRHGESSTRPLSLGHRLSAGVVGRYRARPLRQVSQGRAGGLRTTTGRTG